MRVPGFCIFLLFIFFLAPELRAQRSNLHIINNADLTATDGLGRKIADYTTTGDPKPNRYVGLFFWLLHGTLRNSFNNPDSFNVTRILHRNPSITTWRMEDYYWDEPEDGYYLSMDPWVLRRHMYLIAETGVDFIFLDLTNDEMYFPELTQLLDILLEVKSKRIPVPSVVFFLNVEHTAKLEALYENYYKNEKYRDCWFYYQGKPLMMSPKPKEQALKNKAHFEAINAFFTWRPTWALFPDDSSSTGKWRFMDIHPQRAAMDANGKLEQYVVSKSMGAPLWDYTINCSSCGLHFVPDFDKYWTAPETGSGIFFNEQWNRADSVAAPILLVTGWNELIAGAWPTNKELADNADFKFQGSKMHQGDKYFVDEFNDEFNRDLEPMKGGYTDNFYYQFVDRMRRYKGMAPPQKTSSQREIHIDGNFQEWNSVTPVYTDYPGDVDHRDYDGVRKGIHYTNNTGRNDFIEARVSHNNSEFFFYVKTAADISSNTDKNWMLLFIDADNNKKTGWQGYDYVVNRQVKNDHSTLLEKWLNGRWIKQADLFYKMKGSEMELGISAADIGLKNDLPVFNFHWADNMQQLNDISGFFEDGDSAPDRRFDYHYSSKQ